MKKLLFALVALALSSGLALATVPDPAQCSVIPCDNLGPPGEGGVVVCPGTPTCIPAAFVTLTARNTAGNVIPNALVTVSFGAMPPIAGCPTPDLPPWDGQCDGNGVWSKCFNAGGCLSAANACQIVVNTVPIRNYVNVKSPDWNGGAAGLTVDGGDFSNFLSFFQPPSQPGGCHDYDNDGDTDLGDFVIFAGAISPAHGCP
jgi:hypothetical protein